MEETTNTIINTFFTHPSYHYNASQKSNLYPHYTFLSINSKGLASSYPQHLSHIRNNILTSLLRTAFWYFFLPHTSHKDSFDLLLLSILTTWLADCNFHSIIYLSIVGSFIWRFISLLYRILPSPSPYKETSTRINSFL